MLEKRAYHHAAAIGLTNVGCVEEAERHLDAVGVLTMNLQEQKC